MGHSCEILWVTLYDTHSCGTLLRNTLVRHSCGSLFWDTLVWRSCGALLRSTLVNKTLLLDTLMSSYVKSPKRAFHARLPPKATRQSPKRAFRTRRRPQVKREDPSEPTHQAALTSSFAIRVPSNHTRRPPNPNVTKYYPRLEMSPPPHLATSRFPAPATNIALPHLII